MHNQVVVRPIVAEDLTVVSAIYETVFPDSGPAILGQDIPFRYCQWLLAQLPEEFCLGAEVDERIVGFCFAGAFEDVQSSFIRQNRLRFLGRIALRPWRTARIRTSSLARGMRSLLPRLRTRKWANGSRHDATQGSSFFAFLLAVCPVFQRRGLGTRLMKEIEAAATAGGFEEMKLGVDVENMDVIRFYESLGLSKAPPTEGWMAYTMVKPLNR